MTQQRLGPKLAEGKTKIIYAHPDDPALAVMLHKDSISAGDGARRNTIAGKGALSGRTAANVFALLNRAGIATHFVESPEPTTMIVRRCAMIPVEVVMRRIATGSYLKRNPDAAEGTRFEPPSVEFFLKDDARHDPQMTAEEMVAQGVASAAETERMAEEGRRVFETLERAWAEQDVTLVDLKIEFGRPIGTKDEGRKTKVEEIEFSSSVLGPRSLLVADMIDNDSWRIWPGGEKSRMLDKQIYRNMQHVDDEGLEQVRRLYETVAGMTDAWNDRAIG
ncbi:MAG TPA: phosphoribosylaminoimidazolesuccinocarboxamide synthase [Roseiflexaceae bacterium]|nr:phosphoribosylaminoimidazolesuccinocarboxamide synthase [Roseiflexaceae bacterium]